VNYATDEKSAAETVAATRSGGGSAIALQGDVSKLADIDRLFAARL
jgi:3-oxoacyl-[acyl-carrier protein] reductase